MLGLSMTPISEIRAKDIKGVVYVDAGTPGRVTSVKLIMEDGHINAYSGDELAAALALARERFPAESDSERIGE